MPVDLDRLRKDTASSRAVKAPPPIVIPSAARSSANADGLAESRNLLYSICNGTACGIRKLCVAEEVRKNGYRVLRLRIALAVSEDGVRKKRFATERWPERA